MVTPYQHIPTYTEASQVEGGTAPLWSVRTDQDNLAGEAIADSSGVVPATAAIVPITPTTTAEGLCTWPWSMGNNIC